MIKQLQKLAAALLVSLSMAHGASASHFLGAELTYLCIGPNVYQVTQVYYRDCSGISAPTSATLTISSPGCGTRRTTPMSQVGTMVTGTPNCPSVGNACTTNGHPNYQMVKLQAIVTFSTAETNCPDWFLSTSGGSRPAVANLQDADLENIYVEALVKLKASGNAAAINNSSPHFASTSLLVPFINKYKPITLSLNAIDIDGDSLTYQLARPLSARNTPIPYMPFYMWPDSLIAGPGLNQWAFIGSSHSFSATYPMPSFYVDWNTPPMPGDPTYPHYPAVPYFKLNPATGQISFTPSYYVPNSDPEEGLNKYQVTVLVEEFREINGVAVKVGSILRDMNFIVVDCAGNNNPAMASINANSQPLNPDSTEMIELRPGSPLHLQVASADLDSANSLNIASNVAQVLPGASFTASSSSHPTGTIAWTPTASAVRSTPYYFNVVVTDNACPVKGVHVKTIGLRVSHTGNVTGSKEALAKKNLNFTAYPNPFREQVRFKLNLEKASADRQIIIYNSLGQMVDMISLLNLPKGEQDVIWPNAAVMVKGQYTARLLVNNKPAASFQLAKLQ